MKRIKTKFKFNLHKSIRLIKFLFKNIKSGFETKGTYGIQPEVLNVFCSEGQLVSLVIGVQNIINCSEGQLVSLVTEVQNIIYV